MAKPCLSNVLPPLRGEVPFDSALSLADSAVFSRQPHAFISRAKSHASRYQTAPDSADGHPEFVRKYGKACAFLIPFRHGGGGRHDQPAFLADEAMLELMSSFTPG